MARVDAVREVRITEQTYYRWRKQYGGTGADQLKELMRLRKEDERLRKAVSDLTLEKHILKEAERAAPLSPARRRTCTELIRSGMKVSERRLCRVLGQHRSTQRQRPRGRGE